VEPQILIEIRACLQIVLIGAVSANVVILYVRTIPGDARQRAKERMGNKNETLKPGKTSSQNQNTNKTLVFSSFGEQCAQSDATAAAFRGSG
jgi:hypothetical protein